MKFLKIGTEFINPSAIARVSIQGTHLYIFLRVSEADDGVIFGPAQIEYHIDSPEAKAVLKHFSSPNNSIDLLPNEETESYQAYVERGGTMNFESFMSKYRQHQTLCSYENPSDKTIERLSRLEHELLY